MSGIVSQNIYNIYHIYVYEYMYTEKSHFTHEKLRLIKYMLKINRVKVGF